MKLYAITFKHYAPKDSESGIKTLVLANNDEQVYEFIASEPEINGDQVYNSWRAYEKFAWSDDLECFTSGDEEKFWENENDDPEPFKDHTIRLKGDYDSELNDLYYGATQYGWELKKENPTTDFAELIELGLVIDIRKEDE